MALVEGTNCGFVTTAPTGNPGAGTEIAMDTRAQGAYYDSPSNATAITELGWYAPNDTEDAQYDIGVYDDIAETTLPGAISNSGTAVSRNHAKGAAGGWKVVTGLNIAITGSTRYWLACQLDDTPTTSRIGAEGVTGRKLVTRAAQTSLPDPFGTPTLTNARIMAIYAVYTTGGATGPANLKTYNTNAKANIKTINTNAIANVKSLDTNV